MAFKMAGFSAFTKPDDKKVIMNQVVPLDEKKPNEPTKTNRIPQTTTRKTTSSDIMPQTEIDKADIDRLEGEITGIFDNEYSEAKDDGDTAAMKRYEKQMLKLSKEIKKRGGKDESGVDMSNFGK